MVVQLWSVPLPGVSLVWAQNLVAKTRHMFDTTQTLRLRLPRMSMVHFSTLGNRVALSNAYMFIQMYTTSL